MLPIEIQPSEPMNGDTRRQHHGDERIAGDQCSQGGDRSEADQGDPSSIQRTVHDVRLSGPGVSVAGFGLDIA